MTPKTQTQTPQKNPTKTTETVVETIMRTLKETLQLDAKTVSYIYETMKSNTVFKLVAIEDDEAFIRIGPVECVERDEYGCYVEVALTKSETIALALRLIKYAIELAMT